MESIAESEPEGKTDIVIKCGDLGAVVSGQHDVWHCVLPPKRRGGDISSFSVGSRRRLRQSMALARHVDGDSFKLGITLTIPGDILPVGSVRKLWHNWVMFWKRNNPRLPLLWRIELQERKQAHWHCVVWIPHSWEFSGAKGRFAVEAFAFELRWAWKKILQTVIDWGRLDPKTQYGSEKHACQTQCLDDSTPSGIIGYLADHTSKHKQAQLGWVGRQWGFVNKRMLSFDGVESATISYDTHKTAARTLRRFAKKVEKEYRKALKETPNSAHRQYTGVRLSPTGSVNGALFGRDLERYLRCAGLEQLDLFKQRPNNS